MSPLSGKPTEKEYSAVFSNICAHLSSIYPDGSFIENKWPAIAEKGAELVKDCSDWAGFEKTVDQVLKEVPMSHLYLVTPGRDEAETRFLKDTAHESYAPKWRHFKDSIYLKIPSFTLPFCTFRDLKGILGANRDCNRFYLDLRLNAGGSLSEVGWLISLFSEPGQIFAKTLRRGWSTSEPVAVEPFQPDENTDHRADVDAAFANEHLNWIVPGNDDFTISKQVVLIIGPRTHSVGEVFAAALRDLSSPIIVGSQTAGAGAICRDDFDCSHGYRLCAPFGLMATGSGELLERSGVLPHLTMDFETPDTMMLTGQELLAIESLVE